MRLSVLYWLSLGGRGYSINTNINRESLISMPVINKHALFSC